MIGRLVLFELDAEHSLFFEIPEELQQKAKKYLINISKTCTTQRYLKALLSAIEKGARKTVKYSADIPVSFNGNTVHFYAANGVWRVGINHAFVIESQEDLKATILEDISLVDAKNL